MSRHEMNRIEKSVRRLAACNGLILLAVLLLLWVGLSACAGMQACGDTCPANGNTKVVTFTAPGASDPLLTFRVPGDAENFFASPYHYVGGKILAATELGSLAIYEWQKSINVNGTPGVEAWSLLIKSTPGDNGKAKHEVLVLCHTVKVEENTAQRFFFTEPQGNYLTEGDEVDAANVVEKVLKDINGTRV